jgi:hypothetical protein
MDNEVKRNPHDRPPLRIFIVGVGFENGRGDCGGLDCDEFNCEDVNGGCGFAKRKHQTKQLGTAWIDIGTSKAWYRHGGFAGEWQESALPENAVGGAIREVRAKSSL